MSDFISWIEEVERTVNTRWQEDMKSFLITGQHLYDRNDRNYYGDRRKEAFLFFTRNVTVTKLKKLKLSGHPYDKEPMVKLQTIKKLIKQNRHLEELCLINIKLAIISALPKLNHL